MRPEAGCRIAPLPPVAWLHLGELLCSGFLLVFGQNREMEYGVMTIGMRTCAIWLSATVLASSALLYGAEGEAELGGGYRAEVGLGRTAGEFSYEINFLAGGSKNRSKLTFPLDVPIVYGSVGWFLPRSDKGMLEVGLGVTTSFDDPRMNLNIGDGIARLKGLPEGAMDVILIMCSIVF